MDEIRFDALTRSITTTGPRSRRGILGLVAAAVATATGVAIPAIGEAADGDGPDAERKKKRRCRKVDATCGGKKKCCKGLTCQNGTCKKGAEPECDNNADCNGNEVCKGGVCVPGNQPECVNNADCGANEVCKGGVCVPGSEPECVSNTDCEFNETCLNGTCSCSLRVNGTCVRRCANGSEAQCPGPASCRNHFPADGPGFEDGVCVDEAFDLCDTASCQNSGDSGCQAGEICVAMSCGAAGEVTFRCQDIAVGNDFEN